MPSWSVVIDAWMSVVPVIGESARRRIRCRGSYGSGKMPPVQFVSAK